MAPLTGDPFADVAGTLDQLDAFHFLRSEEAHDPSVHECRLAEVEGEARVVASDLGLDLGDVIFLDPSTYPHGHSIAIERALDFERHAKSGTHTPRHR
jgi:hypothetical protein